MAPRDSEQAEDVVDVTLIDEMLAMSVEERLRLNDRMVSTIVALRNGLVQGAPQIAHQVAHDDGRRD